MKISRTIQRSTPILLGLALAAGCGTASELEDVDFIEDSVEEELGGLDMENEAPEFGDADLFVDLDLDDASEAAVNDEFANDSEVAAMLDAADLDVVDVHVVWGGGDKVQDWSGDFFVNDGALLVNQTIMFDGRDEIAPRTDKQRVEFTSRTLRHRDGLRLRLIANSDNAPNRVLTYRINGNEYTVDVERLIDNPESRDVGTDGDRIVVVAHRRPVDTCETGFLRGHWLQMGRGYGALRGRVSNSEGQGIGHIGGIYGTRRNGERVFFGKYINRAGEFKGIFRGTYRNGHFAGRWLHRAGDKGVLGGRYRETLPVDARVADSSADGLRPRATRASRTKFLATASEVLRRCSPSHVRGGPAGDCRRVIFCFRGESPTRS